MAKFLFVCGDAGGAQMLLNVILGLQGRNQDVMVIADPKGLAKSILGEISLGNLLVRDGHYEEYVRTADIICINTCSSAVNAANEVYGFLKDYNFVKDNNVKAKLVFTTDGLFNHGLPNWRSKTPDYWFVINDGHKKSIVSTRSDLDPKRILIVGQPAFDSLLTVAENKDKIREKTRNDLGVTEDVDVYLWWSQGMQKPIVEDVQMVSAVILGLNKASDRRKVFIPRLHPKLNKILPGMTDFIKSYLAILCHENGVDLLNADFWPGINLCLAADVIFSVTCTEDVKSIMIGGPPVVHFQGPVIRDWFKVDVNMDPHLLPDLLDGTALVCEDPESMDLSLKSIRKLVRQNVPNEQDFQATKRFIQTLIDLC